MNMNHSKLTYRLFSTLVGLLFILPSCSDFLNVTPTGKTVTPTAFSDMRGMKSTVAGIYYSMYKHYSSYFYAFPDLADNSVNLSLLEAPSSALDIYNYNYTLSSSGYWGTIYETLVNINNVIEYQPALLSENPGSATELEIIKGEALFLRALCHFNLCKLYGQPYNYTDDASHLGVAIVLRAPDFDSQLPRSSVAKVYEQILIDLNEAESLLKGKTSRGKYYANELAVYALKSRVYLYMEDWDNVIKYSDLVTTDVPLAKNDDYVSMYTKLSNSETEVILRFNGNMNTGSTLMSLYNRSEKTETGGTKTFIPAKAVPSSGFLNLFNGDNGDIRYGKLIYIHTDLLGNKFYSTEKFNVQDNSDPTYTHINPIVLRSSEMYLNRAEAYWNKNMLTEAANDIKAIIGRAYNKNSNDVVVTDTDKAALWTIIQNERIKELAFEGHKLFDTNRWGQEMVRDASTTSNIKSLPKNSPWFLNPIPQRELDVNPNMKPNPVVNN